MVNFHASSWKSKKLYFDGLLFYKTYKVLDKKAQKSYVSWHWKVMRSLKKNWILVPKMTWGIYWILMQAMASLKISTLMCYFVESILCLSHKSTEKLYVTTLKNDEKFEEGLTCVLKNDMRNLVNFNPTLKSLKICTLMGSFWPKYKMFELKR